MKSLFTSLLVWAAFSMSQPVAAAYIYNTVSNGAGQTVTLHAGTGTSLTYTVDINVTTEGNYDFAIAGITHLGLVGSNSPYTRTSFATTVDSAEVLDASNTVIATMTAVKLPTIPGRSGIGTKLYSNGVTLLPGTYTVNITTSCSTYCAYFQNYFTFVVNPS